LNTGFRQIPSSDAPSKVVNHWFPAEKKSLCISTHDLSEMKNIFARHHLPKGKTRKKRR
jgi:hypothetical protein